MSEAPEERLVPTGTHGRLLVQRAREPRGLLLGFHGYGESADTQLARLLAVPGASLWTVASLQALNRFYRGRSQDVVGSWMTRQDREAAIADNIAYVDAALLSLSGDAGPGPLVLAGFSQGVAMAFRAAVRGARRADAVVAVGGDVPPELVADPAVAFPEVVVLRGETDHYYTAEKLEADRTALCGRAASLLVSTVPGGHEWNQAAGEAAGRLLERVRVP